MSVFNGTNSNLGDLEESKEVLKELKKRIFILLLWPTMPSTIKKMVLSNSILRMFGLSNERNVKHRVWHKI